MAQIRHICQTWQAAKLNFYNPYYVITPMDIYPYITNQFLRLHNCLFPSQDNVRRDSPSYCQGQNVG